MLPWGKISSQFLLNSSLFLISPLPLLWQSRACAKPQLENIFFSFDLLSSLVLLIVSFHLCSALIPLFSISSWLVLSFLRVTFYNIKISTHFPKQTTVQSIRTAPTLTSWPCSSCFARCFIIPEKCLLLSVISGYSVVFKLLWQCVWRRGTLLTQEDWKA